MGNSFGLAAMVLLYAPSHKLLAMGDRICDVSPPPPPPHTHTPHFLGWKQITYFNIYLRFTVIFTGLIRTTFSVSTHIQIFWARTVYIGWEETEIRATLTFIFQTFSGEHAPDSLSVASRLRRSQLVASNMFITQLSPKRFPCKWRPYARRKWYIGNLVHVKIYTFRSNRKLGVTTIGQQETLWDHKQEHIFSI